MTPGWGDAGGLRSRLRELARAAHRRADALVRAAAADVARERGVDLRVAGRSGLRDQRRRGHDLAGLAVAALDDVDLGPGLLHGMRAVGRKPLDRRDRMAGDGARGCHACASRLAVDVHGAGAALCDAAAVLRAGEAHQVAQDPQQRHVLGRVDFVFRTVDRQLHGGPSGAAGECYSRAPARCSSRWGTCRRRAEANAPAGPTRYRFGVDATLASAATATVRSSAGGARAVVEDAVAAQRAGEPCTLALVVETEGSTYVTRGALALFGPEGRRTGWLSGGCLEPELESRARAVAESGAIDFIELDTRDDAQMFSGTAIGCRGLLRIALLPL